MPALEQYLALNDYMKRRSKITDPSFHFKLEKEEQINFKKVIIIIKSQIRETEK